MIWTGVSSHWTFDVQVIVSIALAALLYWRGARSLALTVVGSRRSSVRRWQAGAFYGGLLVVFVALESPLDYYVDQLFWTHMLQHLLLIMIAAPLLVLGDPAVPLLRGLPLTARRRALGAAFRQQWIHSIGRALRWIASPGPVFVIFLIDLYLWHWNRLFSLTLQNQAVHDLEHICFLVTALLFWAQVIDQRPMHARLTYGRRAIYTVLTAFSSNLLAMYFVFAPRPIYPEYAAVLHRPLGITALADQQLAGALMWVPVLFLFGGAFVVCVFKWLDEEEPTREVAGSYSVLFPSSKSTGR